VLGGLGGVLGGLVVVVGVEVEVEVRRVWARGGEEERRVVGRWGMRFFLVGFKRERVFFFFRMSR